MKKLKSQEIINAASKTAETFIAHYGIIAAERVLRLAVEKVRAKLNLLSQKELK